MTRAEILDAAKKCVCGQREQDYGSPESNFQLIADLWRTYLGVDISATDVAMMMALMKIARIKNGGGTGDSFVDLAGYAACGGEINSSRGLRAKSGVIDDHVESLRRKSGRYPWDEAKSTLYSDDKPIAECEPSKNCEFVVDKTIKTQKFPNEESVREDSIKGRYCDNCKWQDENSEGEHCDFCSHNEIESDESHWEKEELPHSCITCSYNNEKSSEPPCVDCVDYNHWEERE